MGMVIINGDCKNNIIHKFQFACGTPDSQILRLLIKTGLKITLNASIATKPKLTEFDDYFSKQIFTNETNDIDQRYDAKDRK